VQVIDGRLVIVLEYVGPVKAGGVALEIYSHQADAVSERPVPDAGDAAGNRDLSEPWAEIERTIFNAGDAVGAAARPGEYWTRVVCVLLNNTPSALLKAGLRASTVSEVRLVQSPNGSDPMLVTPLPNEALVRLPQNRNAMCPMLVTLLGIVRLVRLRQRPNAQLPMLVTLLGMVTLVRVWPQNAESPMLVTGRPLIVSGIVTSPPGPVYPMMVMVPLVVV